MEVNLIYVGNPTQLTNTALSNDLANLWVKFTTHYSGLEWIVTAWRRRCGRNCGVLPTGSFENDSIPSQLSVCCMSGGAS